MGAPVLASRDAVLLVLLDAHHIVGGNADRLRVLVSEAESIAALACVSWGHVFGDIDQRTGHRECQRCGHDEPPTEAMVSEGGVF